MAAGLFWSFVWWVVGDYLLGFLAVVLVMFEAFITVLPFFVGAWLATAWAELKSLAASLAAVGFFLVMLTCTLLYYSAVPDAVLGIGEAYAEAWDPDDGNYGSSITRDRGEAVGPFWWNIKIMYWADGAFHKVFIEPEDAALDPSTLESFLRGLAWILSLPATLVFLLAYKIVMPLVLGMAWISPYLFACLGALFGLPGAVGDLRHRWRRS